MGGSTLHIFKLNTFFFIQLKYIWDRTLTGICKTNWFYFGFTDFLVVLIYMSCNFLFHSL